MTDPNLPAACAELLAVNRTLRAENAELRRQLAAAEMRHVADFRDRIAETQTMDGPDVPRVATGGNP